MPLSSFLIINEAWISGSRPFIMLATVPIICQHASEPECCHGHRLARANCRRHCPRARHRLCPLPAARARCRLIAPSACCPRPPTTAQIKQQESSVQQATCM
ncbi:hypothetical protein ACLOJK_014647 [Asimina triloba]